MKSTQLFFLIITLHGSKIVLLSHYASTSLSSKTHIYQLVKYQMKFGIYFKFLVLLSSEAKKRVVPRAFMSVLDYVDVIRLQASSRCLHKLDGFITKLKTLAVAHCMLEVDELFCPLVNSWTRTFGFAEPTELYPSKKYTKNMFLVLWMNYKNEGDF